MVNNVTINTFQKTIDKIFVYIHQQKIHFHQNFTTYKHNRTLYLTQTM